MRRLIAAVIGALLTVLLFQIVHEPVAQAQVCPASQSFVVGGTGDPGGVNVPNVPGGPRTNIVYPASISPVGGYVSGDESVRIGTEGLTNALNEFRARCPGSGVTIIGYSLGAIVVSDVCDRLGGANTTCITEGNPKRLPGPDGAGIFGVLPTFIPGFHFTGWRVAPAGGPAIVEICNLRDLYCDAVNPLKDPLTFAERAIGTYCQAQHAYPAPCADPVYPSILVPWDVPNPRDLEPVMDQLVPTAPIRPLDAPYVPTRLGDFLPPVLAASLPNVLTDYIPPPVPDWAVAGWNDIVAAILNALPASADVPSVVPDAVPAVAADVSSGVLAAESDVSVPAVVPAVATDVPTIMPDAVPNLPSAVPAVAADVRSDVPAAAPDVSVPDVSVADVSPPGPDAVPAVVDAPAVVSDAVPPVTEDAGDIVADVGSAVGDAVSAVNDAASSVVGGVMTAMGGTVPASVADQMPPAVGDLLPNIQGLP